MTNEQTAQPGAIRERVLAAFTAAWDGDDPSYPLVYKALADAFAAPSTTSAEEIRAAHDAGPDSPEWHEQVNRAIATITKHAAQPKAPAAREFDEKWMRAGELLESAVGELEEDHTALDYLDPLREELQRLEDADPTPHHEASSKKRALEEAIDIAWAHRNEPFRAMAAAIRALATAPQAPSPSTSAEEGWDDDDEYELDEDELCQLAKTRSAVVLAMDAVPMNARESLIALERALKAIDAALAAQPPKDA